jgi:hypothetical protein
MSRICSSDHEFAPILEIVGKAVRDGARFAARRPLTDYPACTPNGSVIAQTRNVTRTGQVSGGTPRIFDWTDDNTVTVTGSCSATTTTGIYRNYPAGAPRVTVSATLTYNSLLGIVGFNTTGLQLRSDAQAAVMGF